MKDFDNGNLKINLVDDEEQVFMQWLGDSRAMNPAIELEPYFFTLSREIKGKQLLIDFTKLNSMNSSTVMPILYFLRHLEENGVKTKIQYSAGSSWQEASFVVLKEVIKGYEFIAITAK